LGIRGGGAPFLDLPAFSVILPRSGTAIL